MSILSTNFRIHLVVHMQHFIDIRREKRSTEDGLPDMNLLSPSFGLDLIIHM